jgi:hypothetical protein
MMLALAACSGRDVAVTQPAAAIDGVARPDHTIGGNIVPRTYEIPAGRASELRRLFRGGSGAMSYPIAVVSAQGTQTQFVQIQPAFLGDRRMVVSAPVHYHAEIEKMIAGLAASKTAPVSSTFELTYWVVEATTAAETTIDPSLNELEPTLAALGALGKRKFKAVDRVATRTIDGDKANIVGRIIRVEQRLTGVDDSIDLEFQIKLEGIWKDAPSPSLDTQVQLKPDKPVVIGDASQPSVDGASNLLLYVVRARRVD